TRDGKRVAAPVKELDGNVRLIVWDGDSGKVVRHIPFQSRCAAFSPDLRLIAAGDESGRVVVWSLASGSELASFEHGRSPIQCLAFGRNPVRKFGAAPRREGADWILAAGDSGSVAKVYDLGNGSTKATCRGSRYQIMALVFSPDSSMLASSGRGPVWL